MAKTFEEGDLVGTKHAFKTHWGIHLRHRPNILEDPSTYYHELWIILAIRSNVSQVSVGPWYDIMSIEDMSVRGWTRDEGLLWHLDDLLIAKKDPTPT